MNSITDKKDDEISEINTGAIRDISIMLSGTDRKVMNKFAREFYEFVLKIDASAKEPVILPTAEAVFTTRKSPCGNGTATFSKHTLRISQRKFDLSADERNIKRIAEFLKSTTIDAQLKVNS